MRTLWRMLSGVRALVLRTRAERELDKDAYREGRGAQWVDQFARDATYAFRQMRRAPVFTAVAVLVLALGIGVNSTTMAFVDGMLAQDAPGVRDPDRLMRVARHHSSSHSFDHDLELEEVAEFQRSQQVFAAVGVAMQKYVVAGADATRERETALFVTGRYFDAYHLRMALGRGLPAADHGTTTPDPSVVISFRYWKTAFGGDSSVLGKPVFVNGTPLAVVGVMPPRFVPEALATTPFAFWIPLATRTLLFPSDSAFFGWDRANAYRGAVVVGRLRAELAPSDAARAIQGMPPLPASPWRHAMLRDDRTVARPLYQPDSDERKMVLAVGAGLGALSGLILAIACANISILLLGRAVARRREIAVRLSLGAPRGRLIRQLATEGALLAIIAGAVGLLLLRWSSTALATRLDAVNVDLAPSWRVVLASAGFAATIGVLFALLPAFHATRASVGDALKDSSAGFDRRRSRLQRGFVIAEVAMSVALVCAAGLMVNATRLYMRTDPGFEISHRVLTSSLSLPSATYPRARVDQILDESRENLRQVPGVQSIAFSTSFPAQATIVRAGIDMRASATVIGPSAPITRVSLVEGDYFGTSGTRLIYGSGFTGTGAPGERRVAIVSDELAYALWGDANPIGRTLQFRSEPMAAAYGSALDQLAEQPFVVVGVAGAVGPRWQRERRHDVYIPRRQLAAELDVILSLRVRAPGDVGVRQIADALHAVDRDLAFSAPKTTRQHEIDNPSDAEGFGIGAAIAGAMALLLACVGLFAVVAFAVAQRTREIGIRLALGATRGRVVQEFFDDGMRLALTGFAIGIPFAIVVMRILESQDEGFNALSAGPIAVIVAVLVIVAALASWLPARRASLVDPVDALRRE